METMGDGRRAGRMQVGTESRVLWKQGPQLGL